MAGRTRMKICIVAFSVLCAITLACACTKRETHDSTSEPETIITETTPEPLHRKPQPHRNKPTSTPTPTPASVYIPRDELPEGQILEKGYFAVLPGEGAYYDVFDCYGKKVGSFSFTDGESRAPTGIHTEQSLSRYYRFNESKVKSILPEDQGYTWINSNENGFYQKDYENNKVILYNKAGKHIQTLSQESDSERPDDEYGWVDMVVETYGDETVVSFSTDTWDPVSYSVTIYFVASDGTINNKCVAQNLPGKPFGLLGRKYFLVNLEWDPASCDVVDFKGKLIMENVSVMDLNTFTLWSNEAATYIKVTDYYTQDGKTYDSSFRAVSKNEVDPDGNLIYGTEYDVEGISCIATYNRNGYYYYSSDPADLVAMGQKDGQTAIKTCESEYVVHCDGNFYAMNDHLLVMTDNNYNKKVISLETGEEIKEIKEQAAEVIITDDYILVRSYEYVMQTEEYLRSMYIIDNAGNIRYMSQDAYADITSGEYIILSRGPYVGIADLNGEWIFKSLTWELTRDEEYVDPWA